MYHYDVLSSFDAYYNNKCNKSSCRPVSQQSIVVACRLFNFNVSVRISLVQLTKLLLLAHLY